LSTKVLFDCLLFPTATTRSAVRPAAGRSAATRSAVRPTTTTTTSTRATIRPTAGNFELEADVNQLVFRLNGDLNEASEEFYNWLFGEVPRLSTQLQS
jgi:hypothetical protein